MNASTAPDVFAGPFHLAARQGAASCKVQHTGPASPGSAPGLSLTSRGRICRGARRLPQELCRGFYPALRPFPSRTPGCHLQSPGSSRPRDSWLRCAYGSQQRLSCSCRQWEAACGAAEGQDAALGPAAEPWMRKQQLACHWHSRVTAAKGPGRVRRGPSLHHDPGAQVGAGDTCAGKSSSPFLSWGSDATASQRAWRSSSPFP